MTLNEYIRTVANLKVSWRFFLSTDSFSCESLLYLLREQSDPAKKVVVALVLLPSLSTTPFNKRMSLSA